MSFTLLYLPDAPHSASRHYDYAVATDALALTSYSSTTLPLMPSTVRRAELVVMVPINMLSWHTVVLPKGVGPDSPRLRHVLGSLLEEHLLDEPEQLHLAMAPGTAPSFATGAEKGVTYWVAACDKHWLQSHLQAIESAGMNPSRIAPEFHPDAVYDSTNDLVPAADTTQIHVIGLTEQTPLLVVQAGGRVVCLPFSAASIAAVQTGLPSPEIPNSDRMLSVFAEPSLATLAERYFSGKVLINSRQQRWLAACRSDWDLAQFDLASSGHSRTFKRLLDAGRHVLHAPRWRPTRWGLGALVVINLLGVNLWAWKEQSAQQAQRMAIQNTFLQTFPQVKVVVDAPLQMQREVTALRQATGGSSSQGLEAVLAAVGAALPPGSGPGAIDMSNDEINMKGLQLRAESMSTLSARLKPLGYDASINGDVLRIKAAKQQASAS